MKSIKKILSIMFAAALCLCSAVIFGCSYPELEKLSAEQEYEIQKAFFDEYYRGEPLKEEDIKWITLEKYLGEYDGTEVIEVKNYKASVPNENEEIVIDGVKICEVNSLLVSVAAYIKAEDKIIDLQQAYEESYISKEDLQEIAVRYASIEQEETAAYGGLSEEQVMALRQAYFRLYASPNYRTDYDIERLQVVKYYGTYNEQMVILLHDGISDYVPFAVDGYEKIGGVKIYVNCIGYALITYTKAEENGGNGSVMKLQDAYESGKISRSDLKKIAYYSKL